MNDGSQQPEPRVGSSEQEQAPLVEEPQQKSGTSASDPHSYRQQVESPQRQLQQHADEKRPSLLGWAVLICTAALLYSRRFWP